ncbi:hypothetical protein SCL_2805 [Sulfuricaulis limicola]|uniref:DUF58 domain-containing protein n=1 Tax=Sulfuricaulis limicola TaxID=1620215 RepID=A0A1B4XJU7_9GAMM|nr:DUF58 domain-containing protein [Sulfuricaulis limicola]BAV35082.1 hypothetical protein SCL_2805 [Sulfuricaulis limicola]
MSAAPAEVVLGRRQLFMLPTRFGLLFAALLVVQLLAAINYGNGLAYALTFLLGSLAVVSMLYTHRNLFRLRLSAAACAPVFAGETAIFRIHLANDSDTPRFGVVVMHDKKEIARVDIAPRGSADVNLSVPAVKRGPLTMPAVTLITRFPLGLLYSWSRRVLLEQTCLVYPRPALPTPLRTLAEVSLEPVVGIRAGGDDYIGAREFQPGDSPRHVDWKAVARGEPWHVKQFGGGYQATVWFDWDTLEGLDTETRLSILTRWVLDAEHEGTLYGLRLPERSLNPSNGEAHQHECLKRLALFGLKP